MGYGYSDKRIVRIHGLDRSGTERAAHIDKNGRLLTETYIADQTTRIIDLFVCRDLNSFTLAADITRGDTTADLVAGHNFTVGDTVCLIEDIYWYQGVVTNVATNTITVDTPFDYSFTAAGADGRRSISDLTSATASAASPLIYKVSPPAGVKWDITCMFITILDTKEMDDALFGGQPALTNGLVFREVNGTWQNIFNMKDNQDWQKHSYEWQYSPKAPSGFYGARGRRTFAGQENSGVSIRIDGDDNDSFQVVVQDDLTALTEVKIVAQGHVVD